MEQYGWKAKFQLMESNNTRSIPTLKTLDLKATLISSYMSKYLDTLLTHFLNILYPMYLII